MVLDGPASGGKGFKGGPHKLEAVPWLPCRLQKERHALGLPARLEFEFRAENQRLVFGVCSLVLRSKIRTQAGFRISSFGSRVSCFVFRVSGLGFWVSGFGFRVSDFEFRVSGVRTHGAHLPQPTLTVQPNNTPSALRFTLPENPIQPSQLNRNPIWVLLQPVARIADWPSREG